MLNVSFTFNLQPSIFPSTISQTVLCYLDVPIVYVHDYQPSANTENSQSAIAQNLERNPIQCECKSVFIIFSLYKSTYIDHYVVYRHMLILPFCTHVVQKEKKKY